MIRLVAALAAAISMAACGNSSNPVGPTAPSSGGTLTVSLTGGLVPPIGVGVLEATMLLDGREVTGAKAVCPEAGGCSALQVFNLTPVAVTAGRHTVSFRLLRHTAQGRVAYSAVGLVLVIRGFAPSERITLVERTVSLGAGDSVSYDFTV